jgi:hypothetical protein
MILAILTTPIIVKKMCLILSNNTIKIYYSLFLKRLNLFYRKLFGPICREIFHQCLQHVYSSSPAADTKPLYPSALVQCWRFSGNWFELLPALCHSLIRGHSSIHACLFNSSLVHGSVCSFLLLICSNQIISHEVPVYVFKLYRHHSDSYL